MHMKLTARTDSLSLVPTALGLALWLVLTPLSPLAQADELFIPTLPAYYNPLKPEMKTNRQIGSAAFSNEALQQSAEDIRSSNMSMEQRALNHQWLDYENYEEDTRHGGKVLSTLFKMGFKTYWKGVRQERFSNSNLVPTEEGDGNFSRDVDYNLRISGDEMNFTVEMDF